MAMSGRSGPHRSRSAKVLTHCFLRLYGYELQPDPLLVVTCHPSLELADLHFLADRRPGRGRDRGARHGEIQHVDRDGDAFVELEDGFLAVGDRDALMAPAFAAVA